VQQSTDFFIFRLVAATLDNFKNGSPSFFLVLDGVGDGGFDGIDSFGGLDDQFADDSCFTNRSRLGTDTNFFIAAGDGALGAGAHGAAGETAAPFNGGGFLSIFTGGGLGATLDNIHERTLALRAFAGPAAAIGSGGSFTSGTLGDGSSTGFEFLHSTGACGRGLDSSNSAAQAASVSVEFGAGIGSALRKIFEFGGALGNTVEQVRGFTASTDRGFAGKAAVGGPGRFFSLGTGRQLLFLAFGVLCNSAAGDIIFAGQAAVFDLGERRGFAGWWDFAGGFDVGNFAVGAAVGVLGAHSSSTNNRGRSACFSDLESASATKGVVVSGGHGLAVHFFRYICDSVGAFYSTFASRKLATPVRGSGAHICSTRGSKKS